MIIITLLRATLQKSLILLNVVLWHHTILTGLNDRNNFPSLQNCVEEKDPNETPGPTSYIKSNIEDITGRVCPLRHMPLSPSGPLGTTVDGAKERTRGKPHKGRGWPNCHESLCHWGRRRWRRMRLILVVCALSSAWVVDAQLLRYEGKVS